MYNPSQAESCIVDYDQIIKNSRGSAWIMLLTVKIKSVITGVGACVCQGLRVGYVDGQRLSGFLSKFILHIQKSIHVENIILCPKT